MTQFAIGQLASAAGVGIDTVRYYERSGLLKPAKRSASGYRKYGEGELDRLNFIRRAQHLGFSLGEISELLAISSRGDVKAMYDAAKLRLDDIDKRIARTASHARRAGQPDVGLPARRHGSGLSHPACPAPQGG